ncbi:MAG: DUF4160 domain-containing protein [Deltaproteobacteria bacterium]|nr:DUF4160 domain-containing protein [Deltaproteobacteria bacterium]
MPTIFIKAGYRFFFYGNDRDEPCHVHVSGHGGAAKFGCRRARLQGVPA